MPFESATQRLDNLGCKSGVRSPCHTTEVGGGPSGVVTLASATEEPVTCLSYCLSMLRMGKVSGVLKDGHRHSKHCRPFCTHASLRERKRITSPSTCSGTGHSASGLTSVSLGNIRLSFEPMNQSTRDSVR